MSNSFGILVLGVLAVASLSLWPHIEFNSKVAGQGRKTNMNGAAVKFDFSKMFPHKAHFIVAQEWFNHQGVSLKE